MEEEKETSTFDEWETLCALDALPGDLVRELCPTPTNSAQGDHTCDGASSAAADSAPIAATADSQDSGFLSILLDLQELVQPEPCIPLDQSQNGAIAAQQGFGAYGDVGSSTFTATGSLMNYGFASSSSFNSAAAMAVEHAHVPLEALRMDLQVLTQRAQSLNGTIAAQQGFGAYGDVGSSTSTAPGSFMDFGFASSSISPSTFLSQGAMPPIQTIQSPDFGLCTDHSAFPSDGSHPQSTSQSSPAQQVPCSPTQASLMDGRKWTAEEEEAEEWEDSSPSDGSHLQTSPAQQVPYSPAPKKKGKNCKRDIRTAWPSDLAEGGKIQELRQYLSTKSYTETEARDLENLQRRHNLKLYKRKHDAKKKAKKVDEEDEEGAKKPSKRPKKK